MLIYKLNLKSALLTKARVMLNPESGDWLTVVASVAESFKSWFENEESLDKSWWAGCPPSEAKFLNFFFGGGLWPHLQPRHQVCLKVWQVCR